MNLRAFFVCYCFFQICTNVCIAEIRLPSLFSDNMVLQRDKPIPVWGWAEPGEKIEVSLQKQQVKTVATQGKWMVYLPPMKAGGPYTLTIKGSNTITCKQVLIGEVWITSGQSNMEWGLFKTIGGDSAIAQSNNEQLRIFNVPHNVKMQPDSNVNAKWMLSAPATTKNLSAVAYHFLSTLQKELNVPVGCINVAFGGTVIESWMSKEVLDKMPVKDKYMSLDSTKAEYDARLLKIKPIIDAYEKAKDSAKALRLPPPPRPTQIPSEFKGTTTIYNGELAPLIPYAVKGMVWYQGESNAYPGRANTYRQLLPAFIGMCRNKWNDVALPFIIVQISGDRSLQKDPVENSGIAVIKEAQLLTARNTPHTALVTTHDCGELDVHNRNKQPIGKRVCQAALALAYGKPVPFTGPLFSKWRKEGDKIIISFTQIGSGLTIKTDTTKPDTLYGFAIAGKDKQFYSAKAVIRNNEVVVSSAAVPDPTAVRYAWANFSFLWNLYNKDGYPASAFRTDDWDLSSK
jgi:sialate O-acetylesterase